MRRWRTKGKREEETGERWERKRATERGRGRLEEKNKRERGKFSESASKHDNEDQHIIKYSLKRARKREKQRGGRGGGGVRNKCVHMCVCGGERKA